MNLLNLVVKGLSNNGSYFLLNVKLVPSSMRNNKMVSSINLFRIPGISSRHKCVTKNNKDVYFSSSHTKLYNRIHVELEWSEQNPNKLLRSTIICPRKEIDNWGCWANLLENDFGIFVETKIRYRLSKKKNQK